MKKSFDFDLIILGSGPAGTAAMNLAKNTGQKIAIIEADKWGGSALNDTDLPVSALHTFSHALQNSVRASRFGASSSSLTFDYSKAQAWRLLATRHAGANSKKLFNSAGVACFSGYASFVSPYEIQLTAKPLAQPSAKPKSQSQKLPQPQGQILAAKNFVIATGACLKTHNLSGLSPAEAYRLPRLPKSVFIVGGGSTGCELANYFAELGVSVTLAEASARLLPKEDEEVGQLFQKYFESVLKIKVLTQSKVLSTEDQKLIFLRGGKEKSATAELTILATGYQPELKNLALESAGVKYTESGITADDYLRTSMHHIFAAGDVISPAVSQTRTPQDSSAERATYEGSLAAANIFNRTKNLRNYEGFIRYTNTFPSVSTIGHTEDDCVRNQINFKKSLLPLSAVPAANTEDFRLGFVKLLADSKNKLLGATVVAPNSDLIVQEVATALRHKFSVASLASTPHLSASWSELIHLAARNLVSPSKSPKKPSSNHPKPAPSPAKA